MSEGNLYYPPLKKYQFSAVVGDDELQVSMDESLHGTIEINVGNLWAARIINYHRVGWTVYPYSDMRNPKMILTLEDMDALLDRAVEAGLIDKDGVLNYGYGWKVF